MISTHNFPFINQFYWYVDEKIYNRFSENVNVGICNYLYFIYYLTMINAK